MSDQPVVRYELRDGISTITIDRPEARNALNRAVREGLWAAFRRFVDDDDALVAILTATGDKVFCAGADLKEMSAMRLEVPPLDFVPQLGRNLMTDKPVIAAVNGLAYAGGFALAQMCDLCIAAETAKFAITEAKWSRGAPWAAPLPWMIPPRVALELLLTAEPIDAHRAHENRPGEPRRTTRTPAGRRARPRATHRAERAALRAGGQADGVRRRRAPAERVFRRGRAHL